MEKISAYIIAFNEEQKIGQALESVQWADEVLVIDSNSTDNTKQIAEQFGAQIVQVPFAGFGALRNAASDCCSYRWIFSLDADERCTPQVREEIKATINDAAARSAYFIPRRNYFMGKWIKYSGWYPDYRQPQLFRKGELRFTDDAVHEGYEVDGKTACLKHAIWQLPFRDLSELMTKMERYSSLGAAKMGEKGINLARMFNTKAGKTKEDDMIPERFFQPLENGAYKGVAIDKEVFLKAMTAEGRQKLYNPFVFFRVFSCFFVFFRVFRVFRGQLKNEIHK